MKSYLNGKITADPQISVFDRGFMYGDGAFESFRTFRGEPFLLKEHLKRLTAACRILKIKIGLNEKKIKKIIKRLLRANRLKEGYIKIIVTRGEAKGHGLSIKKSKGKPLLLITAEKINPAPKFLRAVIYPIPKTVWPGSRMKTLNYLEHILARTWAEKKNANEAFFADNKGNLLEGTTCNIFIVKNKTLITPPISAPILAGVTRNYVLKLAKRLKIKTQEQLFKAAELNHSGEAFVTSSGMGILPLYNKFGPVTKKLQEEYNAKI